MLTHCQLGKDNNHLPVRQDTVRQHQPKKFICRLLRLVKGKGLCYNLLARCILLENIGFKFSLSRREYYALSIKMALKGIIIMLCVNALLFALWGLLTAATKLSPYFNTVADFGDKMLSAAVIVAIATAAYVLVVFIFAAFKLAYYSIRSPRFFGMRVISVGEVRAAVMYADQTKESYDLAALSPHYNDKRYLVYKDNRGLFVIKKDALTQEELKSFYIRLSGAYRAYIAKQQAANKK